MDDGEREFAFCKVFAKPLVLVVDLALEVQVVITNLEDKSQEVDEGNAVTVVIVVVSASVIAKRPNAHHIHFHLALCLHQFDGQPEQSTSLVTNHLKIILFAWTRQGISPIQIHALATVQLNQLLDEDVDGGRATSKLRNLLHREKINVVRAVDCLRNTKNVVGNWFTPPEIRAVLYIVNPR